MKLILNEKQKFLFANAFKILISDFRLPPEKAKRLIYSLVTKELQNHSTSLQALAEVSRAERHIFIRRLANKTGERLMSEYDFKQTVVNEAIAKFMRIMNENSQIAR